MAQQKVSVGCILQRTKCSASSDTDDEFEKFLSKMKTPKSASCCTPRRQKNSLNDSKDNFFSYLTSKYGSAKKEPRFAHATKVPGMPREEAARSAPFLSPFVFSDSDDDSVFVKGTPRDLWQPSSQEWAWRSTPAPAAPGDSPDSSQSEAERGSAKAHVKGTAQSRQPRSRAVLGSDSSDEEVDSLLVRLQQRGLFPANKRVTARKTPTERRNQPSLESLRPAVESERALPAWQPRSLVPDTTPISARLPNSKVLVDVGQMRNLCQVEGCFLQELSDPESRQSKHFRSRKEELAQNLYAFYNRSVFEQKLPEKMEIIWNKKMRKTAGCCVTGQRKDPKGQRYARIMLSEKVCDSADRLRDTLIHELCHAATWLIHGLRDGHGRFWSFYAQKSAIVHPELPVVSRCHNYEIKYKFTYECSCCKTTIGRHSKSLDTQRFVCALCKGQFVLCQPMQKDGTPAKAPLAPFAKYVKENYGSAKRTQQDLSHRAIMKKLSADFAAQASLHSPCPPPGKD